MVTEGCRPVPPSNLEPILPHVRKGLQRLDPLLVKLGGGSDVDGLERIGERFIIVFPDEVVRVFVIVVWAFRPVVTSR